MNSPTSDNNQLRLKGIELATTAGALKTAGVIEDRRFCYKDIFDAAIAEVGPESFLAGVLQGPPIWAQMVKKFHPELFAKIVPSWPRKQSGLILTRRKMAIALVSSHSTNKPSLVESRTSTIYPAIGGCPLTISMT